MNKPANDSEPFDDADDARVAARRAKIKYMAEAYAGRTDLIELGLAVCRDLREAQAALNVVQGKDANLMVFVNAKSEEFAAIEEAMDDATKERFWAGLTGD